MKNVTVTAKFPEVVVDNYSVEVTEKAGASTLKAAVSKAVGQVLKNVNLKRKRIKNFTMDVAVE